VPLTADSDPTTKDISGAASIAAAAVEGNFRSRFGRKCFLTKAVARRQPIG